MALDAKIVTRTKFTTVIFASLLTQYLKAVITQISPEDFQSLDTSSLHSRADQYDVIEENGGRALTEEEADAFERGEYQIWQAWQASDENEAATAYDNSTSYSDKVIDLPPPSEKPTAVGRAIRVLIGLLILLVLVFLVP